MSAETTAITSTTALQATIDQMKREAGAVVVKTQEDYAAVASFLVRVRNVKKQIGFLLDPGIQSAQAHTNELREGKARYIRQIDDLDAIASKPAEDWKRTERLAAEKEQAQINKKRDADEQITVQASVPKVAGIRARVQYFAEVTDEDLLLRAFLIAHKKGEKERVKYLRQFIQANYQALGKEAREVKNSAKLNATIPGVKFTDKDAV
jgi:hypothetical protein